MTPKITEEMRLALDERPGEPVMVEDDRTQQVYVLIPQESLPLLWDSYVRREVEQGLAAVDRGDVIDWDPDRIKAEGRRSLAERSPSQ
jgi:hypothetical protein